MSRRGTSHPDAGALEECRAENRALRARCDDLATELERTRNDLATAQAALALADGAEVDGAVADVRQALTRLVRGVDAAAAHAIADLVRQREDTETRAAAMVEGALRVQERAAEEAEAIIASACTQANTAITRAEQDARRILIAARQESDRCVQAARADAVRLRRSAEQEARRDALGAPDAPAEAGVRILRPA